jgi:hypothetical protein
MKRGFLLLLTAGAAAAFAAPASANVGAPPASCTEIAAANPSAADGSYTIYPNGETVAVYCADMSSAPKEYLTLQNTTGAANYSTTVDSQNQSLVTRFTKIRLDPSTLQVNIQDARFATTSGYVNYGNHTGPNNYAVAADCAWYYTPGGTANVDLTGTPFYVNDTFIPQGYGQTGTSAFSAANQVVDLTGGGYCGDNEPAGHTYLQLGYNGTTYSAAPVITPTVTGTIGANGSYTSPVTVTWASDQPTIASEGCAEQNVSVATVGTTFTCTLSGPGGVSSKSVTVKLDSPASLKALVNQLSTSPGVAGALVSKLDAIAQAPNANAAAGSTRAFINQVNAQTGKALTADQAATLIRLVQGL